MAVSLFNFNDGGLMIEGLRKKLEHNGTLP